MIVKILGLIDILAAIMLFFADFGVFNFLKIIIIIALIVKGLPSLLG